VVAILSLALGIGANTTVFQVIDAVRMKALPVVKDPDDLVYVEFAQGSMRSGWYSTRSARHTSRSFESIVSRQQAFEGMFGWSANRFNLADSGEPRYAEGLYVTGNFFQLLGVEPLAGRTFTPADDTAACDSPGAVISHAFWQREFGGGTQALGKTISLNGHKFPVIGVTPARFFGVEVGRRYDVAIPACTDPIFFEDGKGRPGAEQGWWLSMMGRLKPGWTLERARADMLAISAAVMRDSLPSNYKPEMVKRFLANKLDATPGATGVSGIRNQYERPLWILMASTGLVLLIACANLANILLARGSVREKEITIRLALGASRGRLIRQLLVESLILSSVGASLGIALAAVSSRALVGFIATGRNPVFVEFGLDWRMLGFTTLMAVSTCLAFGLLPALRATGIKPASAMKSGGGRSTTAGRERSGLRRLLVATQVALSLVLLAGSLLFVRSLRNLVTADAGFQAEGVLSVEFDYRRAEVPRERRMEMMRLIRERLAATPGVVSAAAVGWTPVSGSGWDNNVGPDRAPAANSGKSALFNRASPGYFATMGTAVLAGREFTERDTLTAPKVAIVNEVFARKFYNDSTQIVGRTFRMEADAGKPEPLVEIVGVVKNTKYYELREEFRPQAFFPIAQNEEPGQSANFVTRISTGSVAQLTNAIKRDTLAINPMMGIEFRSFSAQLQESLLRDRLMASLSAVFAGLAVVLSSIGLYGVISYMVARRRNEIGIRMALGAGRGRVIGLVLRETVLLLGLGVAAGLVLSYWTGQGAATLLYGVQPYDPATLAASVAFLVITALLASLEPARRATNLDPMNALREE